MKRLIFTTFAMFLLFSQIHAKSDTIVVGVENETPKINPLFDEDHDSALDLVFSGLVDYDKDMKISPDLAKSWEISDDGKIYTFKLRDDVYWHDGVKFSASDVEFTIKSAMDDNLNSPAKVNYEQIEKIEVLSDTEIKITLKSPFPPFLDTLSIGMLPKHLLNGKDLNSDNFNNTPIGTGPYKLVEWKKGQYLKFESFNKYYKGEAKTKNVYLKFVADFNVGAMQLQKGELDAALSEPNIAQTLEKNPTLKVLKENSSDYRALMFNLNNKILRDKNVRIALNYAINKEAIVRNMLHGYGSVADNPIQKSWANDENAPKYSYNPKKAEEILEKDGWKKGKNGFYVKDGVELGFDIYAFNTDPLRVAIANTLASEFKKIGVNVKAYAKPSGSFKIDKVDSFVIGWGSPYDPDFHTYRVFGSDSMASVNENGWNYGNYSDKAVDASLKAARTSDDLALRKAEYSKFITALYQNPAFAFVAYLEFPLVYNAKISGIKPHVLGHHGAGFLWNIDEWVKE